MRNTIENSQKMHRIKISEPEEEIRKFLSGRPTKLTENTLRAYEEEANPTAYGVMQAIARVAMATRVNLDSQLEIEQLAGLYMHEKLRLLS